MNKLSAGYKIEVDKVSRKEWGQILLSFDDANLFQTWEHGAAKWGERNLVHIILKKFDEIVSVAQVWYFKLPILGGGFAHISMGPLWHLHGRTVDLETIQNMVIALHQEFVVKRGVLLRIYSYEKDNDKGEKIRQIFETANLRRTKEPEDVTMILNLSPNIDQLRKNLRKSWRRQLNKAERNGLKVIEGTNTELFSSLCKIYKEMVNRKKFSHYVQDVNLLENIQKQLPEKLKMRTFLCQSNGEYVGGIAASVLGNTGLGIFSASSNKDLELKLKAPYLVEWKAINWLKDRKVTYWDLRGYDPKKYPGPSYYKAGLCGDIVHFLGIFESCENMLSLFVVRVGKFIINTKNNIELILRKSQHIFST
jgi:hypothetical protein